MDDGKMFAGEFRAGFCVLKEWMMKKSIFYLFVAIFLCLNGCATTHETQDMLNSRMNEMSYEEALQRFGPPSQCAEAGKTRVCTWIYGEGGTVIMPVGNVAMTLPVQRPSARLTFTNDVLTWWQLSGNWK
jgi:hypothetical protein